MPVFDSVGPLGLLLPLAIMLVAGLVHGTLGLGFPLVATPLLALIVDVRSAILITLLPTVCVNVVSILKGGAWGQSIGRYWPLAAYAMVGSVAGTRVLIVSDPAPFKLLLAGLVLLYLGAARLGPLRWEWVHTQRALAMLAFGLVAGVSAGTTNVMVPILIIYTLELGLSSQAMVQVFNLCFLAGKLSQIAVFGAAGSLSTGLLGATSPLAVAALGALLLGMRIRARLRVATYRHIVRQVLFGLALLLIAQFIWQT